MALVVTIVNTEDTTRTITVADPNRHGSSHHYVLRPGAKFEAVLDRTNSIVLYEHEGTTILEKVNG